MSVDSVSAAPTASLPAVRDAKAADRDPKLREVMAKAARVQRHPKNDRYAAYNLFGHTYQEANRARRSLMMAFHVDTLRYLEGVTKAEIETCAAAALCVDEIWQPVEKAKHLPVPTSIERAAPVGTLGGDILHAVLGAADKTIRNVREAVQQKVDDGSVESAIELAGEVASLLGQRWAQFMAPKAKAP